MKEPKKHQLICSGCGQIIDMRDLSQVFAHEPCEGQVNYETMKKISHSGSLRIGASEMHIKNIGEINLN